MKLLETQPKLVEQVFDAILEEITSGRLRPGARVIQEQLAKELGVSRQPVQQALLLLRNQGVLQDAPGRGLQVAPLDLDYVRNMCARWSKGWPAAGRPRSTLPTRRREAPR